MIVSFAFSAQVQFARCEARCNQTHFFKVAYPPWAFLAAFAIHRESAIPAGSYQI
jgi:hypothetical protein